MINAGQASRALADPVRRAQYLAAIYLAAAEDARAPLIAEASALPSEAQSAFYAIAARVDPETAIAAARRLRKEPERAAILAALDPSITWASQRARRDALDMARRLNDPAQRVRAILAIAGPHQRMRDIRHDIPPQAGLSGSAWDDAVAALADDIGVEQDKQAARFHQALVRVEHTFADVISIVVPGWNSTTAIPLRLGAIPEDLHPHVQPGARFYAQATIGVYQAAEMRIQEWSYRGV